MAFILTLAGADADADAMYVTGQGQHIFIFDIGICDEDGDVFRVHLALSPFPMCHVGEFELQFYISRTSSSGEIVAYESGAGTRNIITSNDDRRAIIGEIASLAASLCVKASAETVFWSPADAFLPEKALAKYELIGAALRGAGYEVRTVNRYLGYQQWIAHRTTCA